MSSMRNICLVEDEVELAETLQTYLERNDFKTLAYTSAEDLYRNLPDNFKGLYLIDWNLPGEPGIEIVSKIRKKDKYSPIFMVSAYSSKDDIIEGLKRGADDYITKPFDFNELLTRVENATRKFDLISDQLDDSSIKLLPDASAFIKDKTTINLTSREYIVFDYLYKNQDRPVTREDLVSQFGGEENVTERNIDVHIFSLRKKIKPAELRIDTVWGKGYKLTL